MSEIDTDEIQKLREQIERKQSELEVAEKEANIRERLSELRDLDDSLEGLSENIGERIDTTARELKLETGDAYECIECGTFVTVPESSLHREGWHGEGICQGCYNQRIYDEQRPEIEEVLIGATVTEIDINPYDTKESRNRYSSNMPLAELHDLTLKTEDGRTISLECEDTWDNVRAKLEESNSDGR